MYSVTVPITLRSLLRYGPEAMWEEVKKFDATRVLLALGYYQQDPEARAASLKSLAQYCRFFKDRGYEVGAWIWTFIFEETIPYTQMEGLSGSRFPNNACPLDEAFRAFSAGYLQDIARCGVDLILFDDDFRYGFLGDSPGCLCKHHRAKITQIVGEDLPREVLAEKIRDRGKNKYRSAWLQANGDAFRAFAQNARAAVDEIDPRIRMGACACMTGWDVDGITAPELAKILAGKNKPLMRLIGAPYWATNRSWGHDVQDVVELSRMESAWSRFEGLEILAEGDAYPRPRLACPAAFLEGFDTAIRAAGCADGIQKYGVDYSSRPGYEDGYAVMHRRNRPVYKEIPRFFDGKTAKGIRIYEFPQKAEDAFLPTRDGVGDRLDHLFFSQAARMLSHNAVPSTYEGSGVCGMAFGENARHLPEKALENGLILDISAAEILQNRGVDTGLLSLGKKVFPAEERFLDGDHIGLNGAGAYEIRLSEKAEVLSESGGTPLTYRYENAKGQRFLVLNFVTDIVDKRGYVWKHYARGMQLREQMHWLCGKALPAQVLGCPGLFLQCKEGGGKMAVGLWNFSPDPVFSPRVLLDRAWGKAEFLNTRGQLSDSQVELEELPPYGFAAILLED